MPLIAHVGHWSVTLIYLVPFFVVAIWLVRDRLRNGAGEAPAEPRDDR